MNGPSQHVETSEHRVVPVGYQQISGVSSAVTLTPPSTALYALIQAEAQNVRWRDDAEDPTDSVGMLLEAGKDIWFTSDLAGFRAIEVTAGAILNISYYGR